MLVIFHKRDKLGITITAGGLDYAFGTLMQNDLANPTADDLKIANYIVLRCSTNEAIGLTMVDVSVQWGDFSTWNRACLSFGAEHILRVLGETRIVAAWEAFSFRKIRSR